MALLQRERENRRREVRYPTFVKTHICYGAQDSVTFPCIIRNVSTGGAMLEIPEVSLLPLSFRLLDGRQGAAYDCKVAWRRGNEVGVSFTRTIDLQSKADPSARALLAVWKSLASR